MNQNNNLGGLVLEILISVALFFGLVSFALNRLVYPKAETTIEKAIDLPLSRCAVEIDVKVFKNAVEKSGWAGYKKGALSAKEDKAKFKSLVNKNGLAEKVAVEYPDQFKWDPEGVLTMPTESVGPLFGQTEFVKVPTWVLFAFSEYLEYE